MKCWNALGKSAVIALALAFACTIAFAQLTLKPEPLAVDSHTTLTSGSGASFLKIIITSHGNIRYLESPAGRKHIYAEGYALLAGAWPCAMGGTAYDFGYSEARWIGNPTIVQPNGKNTLPLTITRRAGYRSECGAQMNDPYRLELKQVFDRYSAEREVSVTMTVKNVGKTLANGVQLARWFDGDVDSATQNLYYTTPDSVFAWRPVFNDPGLPGRGLSLTNLTPNFPVWADPVRLGWKPDPDDYQPWDTGYGIRDDDKPIRGDHAGIITYNLGDIAVGASKTVKVVYRRF